MFSFAEIEELLSAKFKSRVPLLGTCSHPHRGRPPSSPSATINERSKCSVQVGDKLHQCFGIDAKPPSGKLSRHEIFIESTLGYNVCCFMVEGTPVIAGLD